MNPDLIKRVLNYIFTNGAGEEAQRLVLTDKEGNDIGGWSKEALEYRLNELCAAGRLQRR